MISFLRRFVQCGVLLGLVLPFVYTTSTTFPFVFGKAVFMALLVAMMLVAYVPLALISAEDRPKQSIVLAALGLSTLALILSTIFAVDPSHAFWGNHERMNGLLTLLQFPLYAVMASAVFRTKKEWHLLLSAFLCTSIVMCALATVEYFTGAFGNKTYTRVWGTLGNSIYLGVYASFAVFWATYLWTVVEKKWQQYVLACVIAYNFLILILSESRGALLAVMICALLLALQTFRHGSPRTKKIVLASIVVVGVVTCGIFLARRTDFVQAIPGVRRLALTNFTTGGNRTRLLAWSIAIEAWKEHPIFGWGPENFAYAFNAHYHPESLVYSYYETWFDRAHNAFLDSLAMNGIVGFVSVMALYAALFWLLLRAFRRGQWTGPQATILVIMLVGYLVQLFFAFDALSSLLLFALYIAFVDALSTPEDAPRVGGTGSVPSVLAMLIAVPLIGVAGYSAYHHVQMWRANRENVLSIYALRSGDFAKALSINQHALSLTRGHHPELIADFGREIINAVSLVNKDNRAAAGEAYTTAFNALRDAAATSHDVFDSITFAQLLLVGAESRPEMYEQAAQVLTYARSLSPQRQQIIYFLARIRLVQKKYDAAHALAQETIDAEPRIGEGYWLHALIWKDQGKGKEAYANLKEAIAKQYPWKSADELAIAYQMSQGQGTAQERTTLAEMWAQATASGSAYAAYAEEVAGLGATDTARSIMQAAVQKDPSLADRAAKLYEKIGKP